MLPSFLLARSWQLREQLPSYAANRSNECPVVQFVGVLTGIHDEEPIKPQVFECDSHGPGDSGSVSILHLNPVPLVGQRNQQILLGAGLRRPEMSVALPYQADDLFDHKS